MQSRPSIAYRKASHDARNCGLLVESICVRAEPHWPLTWASPPTPSAYLATPFVSKAAISSAIDPPVDDGPSEKNTSRLPKPATAPEDARAAS